MISFESAPVRGAYIASRTFICRRCGEAYARVDSGCEFIPWGGICESCPPMHGWVAGSILSDTDQDFNRSLPLIAWQREVELHCRWAERGEE